MFHPSYWLPTSRGQTFDIFLSFKSRSSTPFFCISIFFSVWNFELSNLTYLLFTLKKGFKRPGFTPICTARSENITILSSLGILSFLWPKMTNFCSKMYLKFKRRIHMKLDYFAYPSKKGYKRVNISSINGLVSWIIS